MSGLELGWYSYNTFLIHTPSPYRSFESETFKAAAGSSVQKESITLLQGTYSVMHKKRNSSVQIIMVQCGEHKSYISVVDVDIAISADLWALVKQVLSILSGSGESYSFDMGGSGESSAMGSFDAGEGPVASRARLLSHGTSDEHPPSLASSGDQEQPVSLKKPPTFETEARRGPFLEAASSEERARSFETSSDERGRSFDIESSVERGQSFDIESSVERGQSFDIGSSVERGQSFEIGSSFEKGAAYDVQSSLDRGPSFDSEIKRNKPDTFQWGIADEPSQSDSLGREVSIEITGSDGLPVERGSSYEDEHLLRTAEYLGGPAGGSLDLGSSAGESMDLGGSFESMELPKAPPRSPRRGSPRSPTEQPSPAPGM